MGQVAPSTLHQENDIIEPLSTSSSPDLTLESLNLEDSQFSGSETQHNKLKNIPMEKDVEESRLGLRSLPGANSEILSTRPGTDYNRGAAYLPTLQRGMRPPKFDKLRSFFRRKSTDTIDSQYPAFSMSSTPKPALPLSLFKDSFLFDFNKSSSNHGSSLSKMQPSLNKFEIPIVPETDSANTIPTTPQRKILPLPTTLRKQIQRPPRVQINQPSSSLQQSMPVSTEFTFIPPPPTKQDQANNTKTDTMMIHTQRQDQPKTTLYIENSNEEDASKIIDNGCEVLTDDPNNNVTTPPSAALSTLNISNIPTLEKGHSIQSPVQRGKKKSGSSSPETSNDDKYNENNTYHHQQSQKQLSNSTRQRGNTDKGPRRVTFAKLPRESGDNGFSNLDDDNDGNRWVCPFCQYKIFQREWLATQRRQKKYTAAPKQTGKKKKRKNKKRKRKETSKRPPVTTTIAEATTSAH
ncbi:hypothetical protein BCR42DRAFT_411671 [Absidia repens]|uniref:Uncharacterized protein n=1 Tax=Absidia repens TaxID=90262 RepID=A0A1X2IM45_9FUNG|nr:hypothetical protein BCR42DRAFT_411671 [Absidia repens]